MQQQRLKLSNESCLKLYGREKELNVLRNVLKASAGDVGGAQCVFVGGASGTGKSTLIRKAFFSQPCLYGSGKFEEQTKSKPYAALIQCISELCHDAANGDKVTTYKEALRKELKEDEVSTLLEVFSMLDGLVEEPSSSVMEREAATRCSRTKESLEKLKYALRHFIRVLCSVDCPVVMSLDDFHWSDAASNEIIQSIVSDRELTNFVLVGSYRNNEASNELIKWMNGISTRETIMIGDLSLEYVQELLSDVLKVDEVEDLAQLVHSKTAGNVLHIIQMIEYMQSEKWLSYSVQKFCWTWDIVKLKEEISLSDNVVDIVSSRLNRLDPEVLSCLKLCSCFGFRFDPELLHVVKDAIEDKIVSMDACLETAIGEGILERLSETRIKFSHDRILQAVLQLEPSAEKWYRAHFTIGKQLWKKCKMESPSGVSGVNDRILFVCVDQLNMGRQLIASNDFKVDLGKLNCVAASRAASFSAFVPSLEYTEIGLELLDPERRWQNCYALTLELSTIRAEMLFAIGRVNECQDVVREVLEHAKSIDDSLRSYFVQTKSLTAEAKYQELVDTSLEILDKLGEKIPSKPNIFQTRREFARTKKMLKDISDEEILALPKMRNKRKAVALQVMTEMIMTLDQMEKSNLSSVITCRMIELTFQNGLAPYGPLAFAITSQLYISQHNDLESSLRFARLAMALMDEMDAGHVDARVMFNFSFVLHWREPLSITVDYWLDAYKRGMRNGDLNAAFQNVVGYGIAYFYSGLPLDPFVRDEEKFCALMSDYGQKMMCCANLPLYQCILNLTGQSENILDMSRGKAMEYRDKLGWERRVGEHSEWSYGMQIAFYCEEFELATQLASKVESINPGATRALPLFHSRVFFFCLIAIHNARESGKRQYKAKAKKYHGMVRDWVIKQKAINLVHKLQMLDAEMQTLDSISSQKDTMVAPLYDKAIAAATKAGYLQDAALAAQLASQAVDDKHDSREYFQRSCELHESWGAKGVVEYLERSSRPRRTSFVSSTNEYHIHSSSSSPPGYRSRERFDESLVESHRELNIEQTRTYSGDW